MIKEEKELLIKDLCGRLPYGVTIHTWYEKPIDIKYTGIDIYTNSVVLDVIDNDGDAKVYVDNVKPYLRPLSSMTETEFISFKNNSESEYRESYEVRANNESRIEIIQIDCDAWTKDETWLNAHHFDYRGLIEKGLALEAPEGMYNFSDNAIGNVFN